MKTGKFAPCCSGGLKCCRPRGYSVAEAKKLNRRHLRRAARVALRNTDNE